jgi:ATP-binding cassette, subfamily B, bacterial
VIFNLTLRENIAFSTTAGEQDIGKAIATAELDDFIAALPQGLEPLSPSAGPAFPADRSSGLCSPARWR